MSLSWSFIFVVVVVVVVVVVLVAAVVVFFVVAAAMVVDIIMYLIFHRIITTLKYLKYCIKKWGERKVTVSSKQSYEYLIVRRRLIVHDIEKVIVRFAKYCREN